MDLYSAIKTLHILSSTILFGVGVGGEQETQGGASYPVSKSFAYDLPWSASLRVLILKHVSDFTPKLTKKEYSCRYIVRFKSHILYLHHFL